MPSYQAHKEAQEGEAPTDGPEEGEQGSTAEGGAAPELPSATMLSNETPVPGKLQRGKSTVSLTEVFTFTEESPTPTTSTACPSPSTPVRARTFPAIPASWSGGNDSSVGVSGDRSTDSAASQVKKGSNKRKAGASAPSKHMKRPAAAKVTAQVAEAHTSGPSA